MYWIAVLFVAFGKAAGASEASDESQHWAPSFALFFDILGQKAEGTVATGQVLGPPLPDGCGGTTPRPGELCDSRRLGDPHKIGPDDAGHDTSIVPLVGASLELMTPSLVGDRLLRPRLFAHGDVAAAFSYERNLAGEGGVGDFALPKGLNQQQQDSVDEIAVSGQGTRTRMQVRRWVYSAGAGLAITAETSNRRLRLKPSFEYIREELDFIGIANRAVKLFNPTGVDDLHGFRLLSLTATERKSYDGIGGGLELEVDAARLGPFVSSVYLMGRGYYLLGDRKISMSAVNEFGETAAWTAKLQPSVWRSGVGFRFRWSPELD